MLPVLVHVFKAMPFHGHGLDLCGRVNDGIYKRSQYKVKGYTIQGRWQCGLRAQGPGSAAAQPGRALHLSAMRQQARLERTWCMSAEVSSARHIC
jgi:hypothetical protein